MREIRIPGIRRVLRVFRSHATVDREIDDEIRFHLEARASELMRLGLSAAEARERAEREYGDVGASRHELSIVDHRRVAKHQREDFFGSLHDDVTFAARSLMRRPALLSVVGLTLGLGIAANAIMFGVVDQLLLRPPAHVAAPNDVKRIFYRDMENGRANIGPVTTYPVLTALRAGAPAFSDLAAFDFPRSYTYGRGRDAQSVSVQQVSGNYFRLLGVRIAMGRPFTDSDDRIPVGERVAIVSDGFWRSQLGGDERAIGRTLMIQGKNFTLVGVAPRGFSGIDRERVDVWLPISAMANQSIGPGWHNTTHNWWARIIGRVKHDVTADVAAQQATATYRGVVREWKESFRDSTSSIVLSSIIGTRTPEGISAEGKVSLWLIGVAGIVLLIACANVANLLIARTLERRREIAVRIALGVSRGRLARLLLTEVGLLAVIGSSVALAVAYGSNRLVQDVLLPNIVWSESVLDARVFAFTLLLTLVCMVLAGLAPLVQGLNTEAAEGVRTASRQIAGGRGRLRHGLMLLQAALSVILLISAGLFVRSLRNVVTRETGIDRDRVLQVTMPLTQFGFDTVQIEEIYRRGVERVRAIPGVTSVAVNRLTTPMSTASASRFEVPGVKQPHLELGGPYNAVITSGFFATVGAPFVRGRDFTPAEDQSPAARVLIVNETLAKAFWPNTDAIGRCAQFGADSACSEVIGVVRDVMQFRLIKDDRAIVYAPTRHPGNGHPLPRAMLVRATNDPTAIIPVVRRELQSLSPAMPFVQVKTFSELVKPQLQPWRLGATMFTLFGVVALIMAAVGLYSVMAYWVAQRSHEIGVRMALGARRLDVMRLVAGQSARPVLAGLVLGGAAAFAASRWVTNLLYETSPHDPVVYLSAALVLILAAALAVAVPTKRSTAVDPASAIRVD